MRILFLSAFLLTTFFANAQIFKTTLSEECQFTSTTNLVRIGNNFIGFEKGKERKPFGADFKLHNLRHGIRLIKYDNAMKVVKENNLSNGDEVFGPFAATIKTINEVAYLVYYQNIKSDDSKNIIEVKAAAIDTSSLLLSKQMLLLTIEHKDKADLFLLENLRLDIQHSPDSKKILCTWSSGVNNELFISVLNENFKNLWVKNLTLPAKKIHLFSTCIDNKGTAYIGYKDEYKEDKFQAHLLIYTEKEKEKDQLIKIGEKFADEIQLLASENGKSIKIAGTYRDEEFLVNGFYTQTISVDDLKPNKIQSFPISQELMKRLEDLDWAIIKKREYGIYPVVFHPYELEDGSINLIGEFRRKAEGQKGVYILSGSIVNVHFGNDIRIDIVPKMRISAGSDLGDTYFPFLYNDKMIVLYNDYESNLSKSILAKPSNSNVYKNVVLVAAVISSEGSIKRDKIIDQDKENFMAVTDHIQPLSATSILVPIQRVKVLGKFSKDFKWGILDIL